MRRNRSPLWKTVASSVNAVTVFDLSAKGYVNLAPSHDQNAEKYDAELFQSRSPRVCGRFLRACGAGALQEAVKTLWRCGVCGREPLGFRAAPAFPAISKTQRSCWWMWVVEKVYYTRMLSESCHNLRVVGVDLSRDAILAAARQAPALHWLVADLTRLPFADATAGVLIDVLTPADYREFRPCARAGGCVPQSDTRR